MCINNKWKMPWELKHSHLIYFGNFLLNIETQKIIQNDLLPFNIKRNSKRNVSVEKHLTTQQILLLIERIFVSMQKEPEINNSWYWLLFTCLKLILNILTSKKLWISGVDVDVPTTSTPNIQNKSVTSDWVHHYTYTATLYEY